MPTKSVLFSYRTLVGSDRLTNSVRIELSKAAISAVRQSRSNFLFIVNADATVTLAVPDEPE